MAVLLVGCTFLVHFDDRPGSCEAGTCGDASTPEASDPEANVDASADAPSDGLLSDAGVSGDGGACTGKLDGGSCGIDDVCDYPPICLAGVCTRQPKPDNTPCAVALDACHSVPICTKGVCGPSKAQPIGYNWKPGDDNARCCGDGGVVMTTTTPNCGACGIVCGAGQTCGPIATHYLCLGCNGTNSECWSDCCSATSGDHCAPGNCAGACASPDKCATFGAHCQVDVVDYCTY